MDDQNNRAISLSAKKIVFISLIIGIVTGVGFSAALAVKIFNSSDVAYCSGCHTLDPMVQAYREDIHGGKNRYGIMAKCSDCHIPQDGPITHAIEKSKTGIVDLFTEYFTDTSKIDWRKKRLQREQFVHDSGCLSCHTNLEEATKPNHKALIAHKDYFLGTSGSKCVSCHEHVGHFTLGEYLTKLEVKE